MPKISALPSATTVAATDKIVVVQGGTTKQANASLGVTYATTSAESAASPAVTIVNPQYEPGNVLRYGATGDGSTDDTAAIQAALDISQSHPMYLPPASSYYKITAALTIPGSGAIVIGSGYKSIIRQATASANGVQYSGATIYNCTFRDVSMGVSGNITGGTAFHLESVSNSKFFNCQVIADSVSQGFLVGVSCYTAVDTTQASYINEFYGCDVRTAVSANARGYLFSGASGTSANSHKIFGGTCRADSGKGVYVPQNGGGAGGTSNQIVINGVTFESTATHDVHIVGGSGVDQCCVVTGCRFEPVEAGTHTAVLFDTDSYGNVALANFYTIGLTAKVTDSGRFNLVIEPSPTAGTKIQLGEGTFLGQQPYSGRNAVFEILSDVESRVGFGGSVTGDSELRIAIKDNGRIEWGSGSATRDVGLVRSATGEIGLDTGLFDLTRSKDAQDTAANIANVAAAINTTGKFNGKKVWDTTNHRYLVTEGTTAAAPWYVVDGSASVTPS